MTNFWFTLLFSPVCSFIVYLVIRKGIDNFYSRNQERYKHSLELITEGAKYDYQKKLSDFNLYVQKKHQIYSELYRLIIIAEGKTQSINGLKYVPTFQGWNQDDIKKYISKMDIPDGDAAEIIRLWKEDEKSALSKLKPYMRLTDITNARISFQEAKNYYWLSIIYLSDNISRECKILIDKIGALQINYGAPDYINNLHKENEKIKTEIEDLLKKVIDSMRNELIGLEKAA
jgi:hypothetical protein